NKCSKERYDLKRKIDDVVDLFNAHLHHKKAWSDNPYYAVVHRRLNHIIDGYPLKTTRLQRLSSTALAPCFPHPNLAECLFLLANLQLDLEEAE
ncbi:hypothetical protein DD902_13565, partial [Staphylococcus pseudintermedius]